MSSNLWRADLVWGPTYIGRRGGFAIFGTTAEATTAVLNSNKPISKSITGLLRDEFKAGDVNLWINPRRVLASDAFAEGLEQAELPADRPAVFGTDSIFSLNRRMISQVESIHIALQINAARVRQGFDDDSRLQCRRSGFEKLDPSIPINAFDRPHHFASHPRSAFLIGLY